MVKTFVVLRILLVGQDAPLSELIGDVLTLGGYQVLWASTAPDLVQLKGEFELAIIDRIPDSMEKALASALQGKRVVVKQGALLLDPLPAVEGLFAITHRLDKPFAANKLAFLVNMMAPRMMD